MDKPLNIDVAAATAALDAAGIDPTTTTPPSDPWNRDEQGKFAAESKQEEAATPVEGTEPTTEPAATPQGTEEPVPFGMVTDDAILSGEMTAEQLVAWKRAVQADYTLKTQEAAPWRKLGQELGVEKPEDFRTAAEVYQRIQDPRNWPTIHSELTEYMQQYGMSPQEARAQASEQLSNFAPATTVDPAADFESAGYDDQDPALAPLLQAIKGLQAEVGSLKSSVTQEQTNRAQQDEWNAIAQRLTAEEAAIRTANPHYNDNAIEAIYSMMGPEGDLHKAQLRYDSLIGSQVAEYIKGKGVAHATTPNAPSGGGIIPAAASEKLTPAQAHAAAMAHVAALDAQDATS